jgi:DNA-binding transcriptional LysR family regulator
MNDLPDIDLYKLGLLRMVAESRSFTAAAEKAGISQSAISRQIQAMEGQLGVKLLERTTRNVTLTEPGAILLRETEAVPNLLSGAVRRIREEYLDAPKEIRVGISTELSLSHVPGIFHGQEKSHPGVKIWVSQASDDVLFEAARTNNLDLAILCGTGKPFDKVGVIHTITDSFWLVAPEGCALPAKGSPAAAWRKWASAQRWLFPPKESSTRTAVESWVGALGWKAEPSVEMENHDLMVQFVALGMGVAFVPRRALSGFARSHKLVRVPVPVKISRKLVAVVPRFSVVPEHVRDFVSGILFS